MKSHHARTSIFGISAVPGAFRERFRLTPAFAGLVAYLWVIHSNKAPIGALTIGLGLLGVLFQKERLRVPAHLILFGGFLVWVFLTTGASLDPASTHESLKDFGKLWLISLVACNVAQTRRQLQMLLIAWLGVFALYPVRGTFFNFLHGIQIWGRYAWNFIFYNPNDLAALTLPILALAIAVLQGQRERGWVRLSALAGVVLLPLMIFLTQSRGGILALATLGLLVLVEYRKRAKVLAAFFVAAGMIGMMAPSSVWDRLRGIERDVNAGEASETADMGSADQRIEIWRVATAIIADHPVTGVGLGAYPIANMQYVRKDQLSFERTAAGRRDTHSIYLNVAAETGLVGLLLLLGMLGSVLWQGYRAAKELETRDPDGAKQIRTMVIGLIAFLMAGLFASLHRVAFLYLYLGFITSAIAVLRSEPRPVGAGQPEAPPLPSGRRGVAAPVPPRPTLAPPPFRPSVYQRSR